MNHADYELLVSFLKKARLSECERRALQNLCEGPNSAKGMARDLKLTHFVVSNGLIGRAGRKLFEAAPTDSFVRDWRKHSEGWYGVVAPGWRSKQDGEYYWEIRREIRDAMIAIGWHCEVEDSGSTYLPDIHTDPGMEGQTRLRLSTIRERDPRLRKRCIELHGLACGVCGVNLGEIYAGIGDGYIHVHHLNPLGARSEQSETDPSRDMIPVCPNCHAMIHRGGGVRTPEEVRSSMHGRRTERAPSIGSEPIGGLGV